ncbi:RnfH family protein [Polynucleobacter sp. MWH-P3-07-1]|uniref:RnfH family protein n=1 Tax=Polynucleobacter sp. MWH-P3-07-1 TaxID=1743173 RepID=UPI001BFE6FF4|nr:RnfH family protein [Polynucleobacter sp. MWH-P3-07-1]QWD84104.1 RnfH family protein [Polynucleobacter sp. MWH-P3-07-1]
MLEIWICDARGEAPKTTLFQLVLAANEVATVGLALQKAGIANGPDDPVLSRKGSFGVFGKRKDWDSPIYAGDRLELYSPLLIDPKTVRRKKANQNQDAKFQAAAARRKARRL